MFDKHIAAKKIVDLIPACNLLTEDDGTNITYLGYQLPGYGTDEAACLIFKLTYSGTIVATKLAADGDLEFSKKWDDRALYTYTATGA